MSRFVLDMDAAQGQSLHVGRTVNPGDELRITAGGREQRYRAVKPFELGELAGPEDLDSLVRDGRLEETDG